MLNRYLKRIADCKTKSDLKKVFELLLIFTENYGFHNILVIQYLKTKNRF